MKLNFNQQVPSRLLRNVKSEFIGVGHQGYRLHYAIVILGVEESKVLICKEEIIKSEGEGGREWQPMYE